jgi:hypothetical protein
LLPSGNDTAAIFSGAWGYTVVLLRNNMTRIEKEELIALTACPVDWENETGLADCDFGPLEYNWYYMLRQRAINEYEIIYNNIDEILLNENDEELGNLVKNAALRRPAAMKDYSYQAGRLSGLKFMTASERGKHFLPGARRPAVVRATATGPSLFFKDYGASDLREAFWLWFLMFFDFCGSFMEYRELLSPECSPPKHPRHQVWQNFLQEHQVRICFDTVASIGASAGEETHYVCFDVHVAAKTAHAYPVTRDEAVTIMGDGNIEALRFLSGC